VGGGSLLIMVPWYLFDVWGWELRVGLDSGAREGRDSGPRLRGLGEDEGTMCIDGGIGIVGKNIRLVENQRIQLKFGRCSACLQATPSISACMQQRSGESAPQACRAI
jgi:hypothetical protein